jgi:hypothetical protein
MELLKSFSLNLPITHWRIWLLCFKKFIPTFVVKLFILPLPISHEKNLPTSDLLLGSFTIF